LVTIVSTIKKQNQLRLQCYKQMTFERNTLFWMLWISHKQWKNGWQFLNQDALKLQTRGAQNNLILENFPLLCFAYSSLEDHATYVLIFNFFYPSTSFKNNL